MTECHDRGAILVAAMFDAFLSIYKARIADLLRIATGGSGVLPEGNLHPDLVNRLAAEAAKTAGSILRMAIRALDYCPPVDITFGEYLRALVTADADLMPDDPRGYRIAVIEAFRRRGIYPPDVRTLAADSLRWQSPEERLPRFSERLPFRELLVLLKLGGETPDSRTGDQADYLPALAWQSSANRKVIRRLSEKFQGLAHTWLIKKLLDEQGQPSDRKLVEALGLELGPAYGKGSICRSKSTGLPTLEVHSLRVSYRPTQDGRTINDLVLEIIQRRRGYIDEKVQKAAESLPHDSPEWDEPPYKPHDFVVLGGCTLLVNGETGTARHCVIKPIGSEPRLVRQRAYARGSARALAEYDLFAPAPPTGASSRSPPSTAHGDTAPAEEPTAMAKKKPKPAKPPRDRDGGARRRTPGPGGPKPPRGRLAAVNGGSCRDPVGRSPHGAAAGGRHGPHVSHRAGRLFPPGLPPGQSPTRAAPRRVLHAHRLRRLPQHARTGQRDADPPHRRRYQGGHRRSDRPPGHHPRTLGSHLGVPPGPGPGHLPNDRVGEALDGLDREPGLPAGAGPARRPAGHAAAPWSARWRRCGPGGMFGEWSRRTPGRDLVEKVLDFFGDQLEGSSASGQGFAASGPGARKSVQSEEAMEWIRDTYGKGKRAFPRPGDGPETLDGVEGARIYILGPPEDQVLIRRHEPSSTTAQVYPKAMAAALEISFFAPFGVVPMHPDESESSEAAGRACESCQPFDRRYRIATAAVDSARRSAERKKAARVRQEPGRASPVPRDVLRP